MVLVQSHPEGVGSPVVTPDFGSIINGDLVGPSQFFFGSGGGPHFNGSSHLAFPLISPHHRFPCCPVSCQIELGDVESRIGIPQLHRRIQVGKLLGAVLSPVHQGQPPPFNVIRTVHPLGQRLVMIERKCIGIINGNSSLHPLFGGDQHHTVGASRSVNGSCRCVFQDFHRSDVVGVDIRHASRRQRNAIQHI